MKVSDDQWKQLHQAAAADDADRFRALVSQMINKAVAADREVTSRKYRPPTTYRGRPFFICDR